MDVAWVGFDYKINDRQWIEVILYGKKGKMDVDFWGEVLER